MAATVALLDVAAEGGGAALLDGLITRRCAVERATPAWARKVSPQRRKTSATVSAARGTTVAQLTSGPRCGSGLGRRSSGLAVEQTVLVAISR